jgi:hypothetical protein
MSKDIQQKHILTPRNTKPSIAQSIPQLRSFNRRAIAQSFINSHEPASRVAEAAAENMADAPSQTDMRGPRSSLSKRESFVVYQCDLLRTYMSV